MIQLNFCMKMSALLYRRGCLSVYVWFAFIYNIIHCIISNTQDNSGWYNCLLKTGLQVEVLCFCAQDYLSYMYEGYFFIVSLATVT